MPSHYHRRGTTGYQRVTQRKIGVNQRIWYSLDGFRGTSEGNAGSRSSQLQMLALVKPFLPVEVFP
jgi:hypothetical protein